LFANDTLLLIGHGSARYPDAGVAVRRHAESLRATNRFAQVEIGMLNGSPSVSDALGVIRTEMVRVVPFFMEDGYFNRVAVPRAVEPGIGDPASPTGCCVKPDGTHEANRRRMLLCAPVGTHDGIAEIIERQALAACSLLGVAPRAAAVVVVGHGSSSAPGRALALHRHASRVGSTGLFARVEAACLEEAPFVPDRLSMLRAHPVVVVGFFANHGGHVRDDVPALIAAEQAARGCTGRAVLFHGCVTDDAAMVRIILDRAAGNPEGK
jgi:sirohydrochlorin cobaltochelatase